MITNSDLAILGLVAEEPRHGYQIEQDIEQRGMRQWTEIGFSSIYYVLNKLESAGWLVSDHQSTGDRPIRRVYRLTDAGWQVYREAVAERLRSPKPHSDDFDLGLANWLALPQEDALEALTGYRDRLAADLAQAVEKRNQDRRNGLLPHVEALFDHGLTLLQAEFNWVNQYIESFQKG